MKFKQWLENLELLKTVLPNERFKNIWVNQPNNIQQINYWKKQNTSNIFQFPLNQDKFVHFTLRENAPKILSDNLIKSDPAFGISLNFGMWLPVVQFAHIIRKRNSKLFSPGDIAKLSAERRQQLEKDGWQLPNFGQEIVAIVFKTDKLPNSAHREEVVWDGPLPIKDAQVMSSRDAIRMLKKTPYGDKLDANNDSVEYV